MPNIDFNYPNEKPLNYLQRERAIKQMYLRVFDAHPNSTTIFTWDGEKYLIGSDVELSRFHDAERTWGGEQSKG